MAQISEREANLIRLAVEGGRRRMDREVQQYKEWAARSAVIPPQPEWTMVKGVRVLRIGNSPCIAAPNGKRHFDMIDVEKGEYLCQIIGQKEARQWLLNRNRDQRAETAE